MSSGINPRLRASLAWAALALGQAALAAAPARVDGGSRLPARADAGTPDAGVVRFAVIGDYGSGDSHEAEVARLVRSWSPDFVVTTGDNNYPHGSAATIDEHIGRDWAAFIGEYRGRYGPGSATNRFWPSPGNHDWRAAGLRPYLEYFHLPGNERYYEADLGLVHLFMLDLDRHEPDGNTADSVQARWLKARLAASQACFQVVAGHQTPYSSGDRHGSDRKLQWPFAAWGADVVVVGHEHLYERLEVDGIPYLVNGAGGAGLYDFDDPLPESRVRFRGDWGALRVTATAAGIGYEFITVKGQRVDAFTVPKRCPPRRP